MRKVILALLGAASMMCGPAMAQTSVGTLDLRVGKLEKEMRAVQRTVYPGGTPIQPDLSVSANPAATIGTPASSPVADLTARVDTIEKQLATLTGQVEQAGFRMRQQDEAIKLLEARFAGPADDPAADPAAVTDGPAPARVGPPGSIPDTAPETVAVTTPKPVVARPAAAPPAAAIRNDPARKALVAAVEMPATGDAAEDAYTYGFRLYAAKLYPEAAVKLKEFVAKHPGHKRASYAQNLLGRAYYDDGKPALAAVALYDNYQKMPKGERAPESLYWLGQALTKLKKLPDACKVYDELSDVYGAKLSADLKSKTVRGRADAKCAA